MSDQFYTFKRWIIITAMTGMTKQYFRVLKLLFCVEEFRSRPRIPNFNHLFVAICHWKKWVDWENPQESVGSSLSSSDPLCLGFSGILERVLSAGAQAGLSVLVYLRHKDLRPHTRCWKQGMLAFNLLLNWGFCVLGIIKQLWGGAVGHFKKFFFVLIKCSLIFW